MICINNLNLEALQQLSTVVIDPEIACFKHGQELTS